MIKYKKSTLLNGLQVVTHNDINTPMVAINIMYNVGAKDENENETGFAHLFEHLMFGGSANIPEFDKVLQLAGGENNAFTSNDVTNYYITIPKQNIETALWLESDRMLKLDFNQQSLNVQKNVVIEEFKESYLNKPYGDVWQLIREMAYTVHPYKWQTIGKSIKHIEQANLERVKSFFYNFYAPNNATLVISGNLSGIDIEDLVNKWFSTIPKRKINRNSIVKEPKQSVARIKTVCKEVSSSKIYKAYKMVSKNHSDYYVTDTLMDILGGNESSMLYLDLVKKEQIFSSISAYILDSFHPGLAIIEGVVNDSVKPDVAVKKLNDYIKNFKLQKIEARELEKVKNKIKLSYYYANTDILNKAIELAYATTLGDTNLVNKAPEFYENVTISMLNRVRKTVLDDLQSSTLIYVKK